MATKELTEYVCDMDEYHAMWKVSFGPFVAIPFVAVAILVALAFIIL